jgi:hypothetical protein
LAVFTQTHLVTLLKNKMSTGTNLGRPDPILGERAGTINFPRHRICHTTDEFPLSDGLFVKCFSNHWTVGAVLKRLFTLLTLLFGNWNAENYKRFFFALFSQLMLVNDLNVGHQIQQFIRVCVREAISFCFNKKAYSSIKHQIDCSDGREASTYLVIYILKRAYVMNYVQSNVCLAVPSKDHSIFPRKSMFIGVFMDLKGFVLK